MRYSIVGRTATLAAAATLLFAGCADLGPTAVVTKGQASALALDLDAGQFRLDIGTRELRHPDGRVVDLTVDETELLATEFAAQASLATLASYMASTYTDADDQCDWHREYCEGDMLRAQGKPAPTATLEPVATPSLQEPGTGPDASVRKEQGDFERTYGRIRIRISKHRPRFAVRAPDPVVVQFYQGTSCADVRIAMDAAYAEAQRRKATLSSLFNTVFGWTGFTIEGGVLRGRFGASARGAVAAAVESMETGRVTVALQLLQGLYRGMGCSDASGGGMLDELLPPGWEETCTDVWGTIVLPWNQVYTGWYKECVIVGDE